MSAPDKARAKAAFGAPELSRLVDALATRLARGRPLTGKLSLDNPAPAEREAIDALFGRGATSGRTISVSLDELSEVINEAKFGLDLRGVVEAIRGPVRDERAAKENSTRLWETVSAKAGKEFSRSPDVVRWLTKLLQAGVLKRQTGSDADAALALVGDLSRIATALPAKAEAIAAFSARLFGDSHALDPGSPRAALAVRLAAKIGSVPFANDAEGRRAAWASVGILCDELSAPVLVLNLPTPGETHLAASLRLGAEWGEPTFLSLRQLMRYPIASGSLLGSEVFVCENPTLVAMAALALGRTSNALVCTGGQFATPALVLVRQLKAAGARLRYHGDFDPAGVAIANRIMREAGATPWRFGSADYAAAPKGVRFLGIPGEASWDRELAAAMRADGRTVHEEGIFESLAADLCGTLDPKQPHSGP